MSKKIKTEILTLCDYALTSAQGKLTIVGIFDRVFVNQLPTKYPRMFVVAVYKGEPNTSFDASMSLIAPSGKPLLPERAIHVEMRSNGKANILTDIANIALEEIGEYSLVAFAAQKEVGRTSFYVSKAINTQEVSDSSKAN